MASIREIVQEAIARQYLSLDAENHLRQLLGHKLDHADFQAFMALQTAFMDGTLRQESRDRLQDTLSSPMHP